MQTTIDTIREAHAAAMRAIHQANRAFGDDPEIRVLVPRLQEAGASLREAENQAVRIKSRRDLVNGEATHPTQTPEYWEKLASDERSFARHDRNVESKFLRIKNAEVYEAKAKALRAG